MTMLLRDRKYGDLILIAMYEDFICNGNIWRLNTRMCSKTSYLMEKYEYWIFDGDMYIYGGGKKNSENSMV
jgi:hypothetical protein